MRSIGINMKHIAYTILICLCIGCTKQEDKPYKYNLYDEVFTVVGNQAGQVVDRWQFSNNEYQVKFLYKQDETITNSKDLFITEVLREQEIRGLK